MKKRKGRRGGSSVKQRVAILHGDAEERKNRGEVEWAVCGELFMYMYFLSTFIRDAY